MSHEPWTVFYLVPQPNDTLAETIVDNDANQHWRCVDPFDSSIRYLRVGLNQTAKLPDRLVTFGCMATSDIILPNEPFSTADQCYFDFHRTTGELLLHNISKGDKTQLFEVEKKGNLLWTSPRQCVVQYNREYVMKINRACFRLVPRRLQGMEGKTALFNERLEFVRRMPNHFQWHRDTSERLQVLKRQRIASVATDMSCNSGGEDMRQDKPNTKIRYLHIQDLRKGSLGSVDEVLDLHTGDHFARKVYQFKCIPGWKIFDENQFKLRIQREVKLVKKVSHHHIVPYLGFRGSRPGEVIEVIMPVYEGSLRALLTQLTTQSKDTALALADRMLYQMLLALDHVHSQGIIHRDIKPENILYQGDQFLLTDFGIAKDVDSSRTMVGTFKYCAPEILALGPQTEKVDIYSLGVTYAECLAAPEAVVTTRVAFGRPQDRRQAIQALLEEHRPRVSFMLAQEAEQRPGASPLLSLFYSQSGRIPMHNARVSHALPLSGGISSLPGKIRETTLICPPVTPTQLTPMDWTPTKAIGFDLGNPPPTALNGGVPRPQMNLQAIAELLDGLKSSGTGRERPVRSVKSARSARPVKSVRSARSLRSVNSVKPMTTGHRVGHKNLGPPEVDFPIRASTARVSKRAAR